MPQMLRSPSAGPLVGHTTSSSARIWLRGVDAEGFRTIGVAALFDGKRCVKGTARYLRLHREYDRTGITDFTKLKPGTHYKVRVGSIVLDSTDPDLLLHDEEVWKRLPPAEQWLEDLGALPPIDSEASFETFPDGATGKGFSFLFGSCRYPGILMMKKRADEMFCAMTSRLETDRADPLLRPRFTLMIGDQIYADQLHRTIPNGRAESPAEFHDRYMEAFTSPYFRQLTASLPTYMILDDHEIEDNWVAGRLKHPAKRSLFNHAIHAYLSYQWLHGPQTFGKRLYYAFDYGDVPFFVLDERTQRIRDDPSSDKNVDDNHLLGYPPKSANDPSKGQLDLFLEWLVVMQKERGNVPKFVVSPSVFAPNDVADVKKPYRSDSWPAFPQTRRAVLETIIENNVANVVFLCGDVHSAHVCEITLTSKKKKKLPKLFCITSSAFYWPFPFADGDERSFVHDSVAENDPFVVGDVTMHYKASAFEQDDNYTRVTVRFDRGGAASLDVDVFSRKNTLLKHSTLKLG